MKSLLKRLLPSADKYDDRIFLQDVLYACFRDDKIKECEWVVEFLTVRHLNDKQVEEKTDYYTSLLNQE